MPDGYLWCLLAHHARHHQRKQGHEQQVEHQAAQVVDRAPQKSEQTPQHAGSLLFHDVSTSVD
jgi:hypothetical protein